MQELLEILGVAVLTVLGFVILYYLFQVVKFIFDWYIQTKLVELYDQKDRLWDGVNDAYDNFEYLKERFWDYDKHKKELYELKKDFEALEEYVLNSDDGQSECNSIFSKREK